MGKDSSMDDKWKALESITFGVEIRINWDWNGNLIPTRLAILWGRYVEFHIFPYSYAEYLQLMQQPAGRASYLAYLQKGGLPELYNLPTVESEKTVRRFCERYDFVA